MTLFVLPGQCRMVQFLYQKIIHNLECIILEIDKYITPPKISKFAKLIKKFYPPSQRGKHLVGTPYGFAHQLFDFLFCKFQVQIFANFC